MSFDELTEEQKLQAKQNFLVRLADKDMFIKTMKEWHPDAYGKENDDERGPSYGEMADADRLVSDDVMRQDGVDYVPEDFGPAEGDAHSDIQKLNAWLRPNLTMTRFRTEHPKFNMGDPAMFTAIIMALEWAVDKVLEHCSKMERA